MDDKISVIAIQIGIDLEKYKGQVIEFVHPTKTNKKYLRVELDSQAKVKKVQPLK
jgi:hypothetical protein